MTAAEKYEDKGIDPLNYDFEELLKLYEGYQPVGWGILIRVFKPLIMDKTKGGLLLPDILQDDKQMRETFYGFSGLVIKVARGVYKEETRYKLTGEYCKPGDWVTFSRGATCQAFAWKGLTSVRIEEDCILSIVDNPINIKPLASPLY